jgi:gliding motility-associated-like protein
MKCYYKYSLYLCCCFISICNAQTVNFGDLYVSQGTLMSVMSDFDNKGIYENNGEVIFTENFNNDGITTFNSDYLGFTRFEGSTAQNISGKFLSEFNKIMFYNTSVQPAFHLSGDITINSTAEFLKGIVDNDNYGGSVIFFDSAISKGMSDDSYIDGEVMKEGSSSFLFPIGDKSRFRFAAISAPLESDANYMSKYIYENSNSTYPHQYKDGVIEKIDDKEYWLVEKISGSQDVLVTLSWDESTTPPSILDASKEDIHVVRWDSKDKLWKDEGGVVDLQAKTVTTESLVAGYGIFTLARVKSDNLDDDIVIYNAVSPNGDGQNDYFFIDKINRYKNRVSIYNRWGVKVFETDDYDSHGNVFNGISKGRVTVKSNEGLPDGTYFYIVEYEYSKKGHDSRMIKKSGYLYLKSK